MSNNDKAVIIGGILFLLVLAFMAAFCGTRQRENDVGYEPPQWQAEYVE